MDKTNTKDLDLVGRSEDGTALLLGDQDGTTFALRISDQLKAAINQPRLVAVSATEESVYTSVKEIQSRLRSGERADSIARTTEWDEEKIEKFSGPIMQERAFVIGHALETQLRREAHSPTLMVATIAALSPRGVDMQLVEWNTWRRDDGLWNIILIYPNSSGTGAANWAFDATNRTLVCEDESASWICGEERVSRSTHPTHGMVFPPEPTSPAPRLVSVKEKNESGEPIRISSTPEPVSVTQSSTRTIDGGEPESIDQAAKRDGITKRIRIPSWDDIMFGKKDEGSTPPTQ